MNCRGVYRRLSAYIDSDLSPGIKQGVEEHLEHCPACQKRLQEFEAIVNAAHSLPSLTVSEGFEERVLAAVQSKRTVSEILGNVRYRLTLAGVAFTVTAAAIFFVVGPPASKAPTFGENPNTNGQFIGPVDFRANPEAIVPSFPIPDSGILTSKLADEEITPVDSMPRPSEYVMPIQKVSENIDGKF